MMGSAHAVSDEGSCTVGLSEMEVPFVPPKVMLHGTVQDPNNDVKVENVLGCCAVDDLQDTCITPSKQGGIIQSSLTNKVIGQVPQMNTEQALQVLDDAKRAWNGGSGTWPQMSLRERIEAVEKFIEELKTKREQIVVTLMWEIGKNRNDAEAEFDRTIQFVQKVRNQRIVGNYCLVAFEALDCISYPG